VEKREIAGFLAGEVDSGGTSIPACLHFFRFSSFSGKKPDEIETDKTDKNAHFTPIKILFFLCVLCVSAVSFLTICLNSSFV
jgi:hypothetical protein